MIKSKFGGSLRSKGYQAQENELLCKILCIIAKINESAPNEGITPYNALVKALLAKLSYAFL